jgi:hypothetical protein
MAKTLFETMNVQYKIASDNAVRQRKGFTAKATTETVGVPHSLAELNIPHGNRHLAAGTNSNWCI